jgi:hypothetical protein
MTQEMLPDEIFKVGQDLVSLVCGHSQRVYSARRAALRSHVGFAVRDRDPGAQPILV